MINLPTISSVS